MTRKIPSGTVTFLFTDIEGSTKLAQLLGDSYQLLLQTHNKILNDEIDSHNGFVFEIIGDSFCSSFANPADALKASVSIQKKLFAAGKDNTDIKVRMGIHIGNAEWKGKKYIGYLTLAETQRIMSVAYGQQILVSNDISEKSKRTLPPEISFRDLGERRLKDLNYPVRLYQVLSPGIRIDFPPIKSTDARQNNLPVQLTSFIGRENDLREIKKLLDNTHLLTLTGAGGTGKTRLSLRAAEDLIDDFSDGVWFIDLAPLRDESLLSQTVNDVLKVRIHGNKTNEAGLIEYLKNKEMLLLLDNCEHLIEKCSQLTELILKSSAKIKVIASSREALKIPGEQIFYVRSLSIPENDYDDFKIEDLKSFESISLFLERAISVKSDFQINKDNAETILKICRRLDGIPLAIELTAARVKHLTPEKIYDRLNDRFKFLTSGFRTTFPRQQTLKAMVDWSYELLSEKEKILFNRLSVFSGGWTLEAAEEICSDEKILKNDILELHELLMDKSLIISSDKNERYGMLETLHEYSKDNLELTGETDKINKYHLNFFIDTAESARENLEGPQQKSGMIKIESENFNFRKALQTAIANTEKEKGLRLSVALGRYWETRGVIKEALNYFKILMKDADSLPIDLKANAFQWMGTFYWLSENTEMALLNYKKSYEINSNLNNPRGISVSLNNLALIANSRGEYKKAKDLSERAYKLLKKNEDKNLKADILLNMGAPLVRLKEMEYAEKVFLKSFDLYKEIKDERGIAMSLNNLGMLKSLQGDIESSKEFFEKSLKIQRELKENRVISNTLENLGVLYTRENNFDKAEVYLEESLKINIETGSKLGQAKVYNNLGFVKSGKGKFEEALELHKEGLRLSFEMKSAEGICFNLDGIIEVIINTDFKKAALLLGKMKELILNDDRSTAEILNNDYHKFYKILSEKLIKNELEKLFSKSKTMRTDEIVKLALGSLD